MDEDEIAKALQNIATQLKYLGNGDAGTTMGAVEHHSVKVHEGLQSIASAVAEGLHEIAEAIRERGAA